MGRIDRQQVGPLYRPKRVQDPFQVSSSPIGRSDKSESIFLPVIWLLREEIAELLKQWDVESVRNPGTQDFYTRLFLVPKKNGKLRPVINIFFAKSVCKQTAFQDGVSQVSKTVDNGQRLGCLHRSDGCIIFTF